MQPMHRLAHLAQRPDGGVEWACPRCGRYLVRYPETELVLAAGAPGPAHILGPLYRDDPTVAPTVSELTSSSSMATPWSGRPTVGPN
jgi:hypothetical protein